VCSNPIIPEISRARLRTAAVIAAALLAVSPAAAQVAPSPAEVAAYTGLHAVSVAGDAGPARAAAGITAVLDARDAHGRTPLHVATYYRQHDVMRALVKAGADANALDSQKYDIVTIAAVADDTETLKVALEVGCAAGNVTSPWDGTALIAAAHLGHEEVVRVLIEAGAPPDHVNTLHWTALIESVARGHGGKRHQETARYLVKAGANRALADKDGKTPLDLAKERGYEEMVKIISSR
jgi:ankyrin repeat protein